MKIPSVPVLALLALPAPAGQEGAGPDLVDLQRTAPAPPGGTAQVLQLASGILGETRRVQVVLPPSYERSPEGRRYPVTVVLDGDFLLSPVAAASAELSANGQIPEAVLVGVENVEGAPWTKRVHDLTPPGLSVSGSSREEGGDDFLDFLEEELLPALDRRFRTAAPRTLVGLSSGGVLATWAAATRPVFSAVVSIDAPVHLDDGWLAERLLERAEGAEPGRVRYASLEARYGWPQAAWERLQERAPATWRLHRETFELEGHETVGWIGAYVGLKQVFGDTSRLSAPPYPTTSILPYYDEVSASLGAPVPPPRLLLHTVVEDLCMEGRGAAARAAYELLAAAYGAPDDAAALLARIAEVERRPPPAETVEGLLAMPFPTPEEVAPFLGEWVGDLWMNPDEKREDRMRLRIRVVDGRVVGETVHRVGPQEELVQAWQHLRVTPVGLTWGYLNGMRPRGVLLFEARLEEGLLTGLERFGGIDFRRPDGSAPPDLHFAFRRARESGAGGD